MMVARRDETDLGQLTPCVLGEGRAFSALPTVHINLLCVCLRESQSSRRLSLLLYIHLKATGLGDLTCSSIKKGFGQNSKHWEETGGSVEGHGNSKEQTQLNPDF